MFFPIIYSSVACTVADCSGKSMIFYDFFKKISNYRGVNHSRGEFSGFNGQEEPQPVNSELKNSKSKLLRRRSAQN
jgi:hypothetical protein